MVWDVVPPQYLIQIKEVLCNCFEENALSEGCVINFSKNLT